MNQNDLTSCWDLASSSLHFTAGESSSAQSVDHCRYLRYPMLYLWWTSRPMIIQRDEVYRCVVSGWLILPEWLLTTSNGFFYVSDPFGMKATDLPPKVSFLFRILCVKKREKKINLNVVEHNLNVIWTVWISKNGFTWKTTCTLRSLTAFNGFERFRGGVPNMHICFRQNFLSHTATVFRMILQNQLY